MVAEMIVLRSWFIVLRSLSDCVLSWVIIVFTQCWEKLQCPLGTAYRPCGRLLLLTVSNSRLEFESGDEDKGKTAIARGQTHTPFYYGSHADAWEPRSARNRTGANLTNLNKSNKNMRCRNCIKSKKDLDEVKRLGESQSWLTPCKRAGGPRSLVTDCDLVTCLEEELQHPQCFILPDNSSWLPFWDSSRKACLSRKCFKLRINLITLICLDVTE